MEKLLTRDEKKEQELNDDLAKTVFDSAEKFVELYSIGWLNRSDNDIRAIAQKISDTYQNVQLKGREIVFVSQTEVMVNEIIEKMTPWKHLTKIKHAVAENNVSDDIFLLSTNPGYLFTKDEDGEYTKVSSEKFFRSEEETVRLYEEYSSYYSENKKPSAIVQSDDSETTEDTYEDNPYLEDDEENSLENVEADNGIIEYKFAADDFKNLDDSFVEKIYDIIVSGQ